MAFKKSLFSKNCEFKITLPPIYGGGEAILNLRLASNDEALAARSAFLSLPESERSEEATRVFIRKFVCSLLNSEPQGFDEFPPAMFDGRTLADRAFEYFTTDDDQELQAFLDSIMLSAYSVYRQTAEPDVFFRSI